MKKTVSYLFLLFAFIWQAKAQTPSADKNTQNDTIEEEEVIDCFDFRDQAVLIEFDETPEPNETYFLVEEMPEFPGGELAIREYIAKNITYPDDAKQADIQGKVYVRFVVNKDGNVEQVSVARGVYTSLDSEAIRVVSSLPAWTPGKQKGKAVDVWYTVPINFEL